MIEMGKRLRVERIRLGMTQERLAFAGGVLMNAQGKYERGQRSPNAVYLAKVAAVGVDILYVVTGRRSVPLVSADEAEVLLFTAQLRRLPKREQKIITDLVGCIAGRR